MDRIIRHSKLQVQDSIHAGVNYVGLARSLSEPRSSSTLSDQYFWDLRREAELAWTDRRGKLDGTIYTYDFQLSVRSTKIEKLINPQQVSEQVERAQRIDGMAFLIFLCGNPPPLALAGLAVACRLDPEYLRRHLSSVMENRAGSYPSHFSILKTPQADDLTLPSLPSISRNIVQLRYTSIGRSKPNSQQRKTDFPGTSESIVREHSSWENGYMSVEQQISICVEHLPAQNGGRDSWLGMPLAYLFFDRSTPLIESQASFGSIVEMGRPRDHYQMLTLFQQ